ncbi:ABC transporter permease [Gulosibacter sediminis]|uniref:ABC transporter permease n=1 Tax=Gulosibacter sediminis TaxID=1729695 RepID=UPI0024A97487|nr:ABC transporter permease [Gulosibacter sediminis]
MATYLLRRIGFGVLIIWAAFTAAWLILFFLPGDAVAAAGVDASDPAALEARRESLGLNRPWYVQYFAALFGAVRGDFGVTVGTGEPVSQVIARALPNTLELVGVALVFALIIGLVVGIASVYPRAAWLRALLSALPPIAISLPSFWLGLLLLQAFSFGLGWFPAYNTGTFASIVLPALSLAITTGAYLAQVLASSLRIEMASAYAEQVRAKGATRPRIVFGHALRGAALPSLNMVGILVAGMLGGTVVTETVFSRNGLGRELIGAVESSEISVVLAIVTIAALVFVVINLIVDLVTPLIDRRIALTGKVAA